METGQPYLSVVVTARNDDHGGNLLGRMQIFVSGWIAQARRHNLPSELIIVEWNPSADRPRLEEMLRWPEEFGPCDVRFLEVPPELHRRYQHAEALPLYQMIAKNVGIRRARGGFILATNIDILFSDELMAFLAEQRLETDRMYRIDRYDAMGSVPVEASIEEQLAFCRTHLLRVNAREGTFPLTPEGLRTLERVDIATAESGLRFGSGWFPVEHYWDGEIFRWIDNDAELDVSLPSRPSVLRLELEPGPGMGGRPMMLQVCGGDQVIITAEITRRSLLRIPFSGPGSDRSHLRLRITGGGEATPNDPRILNFRVFTCRWERSGTLRGGVARAPFRPWKKVARIWHGLQELVNRLATSGFFMSFTIAVPPIIRRAAIIYLRSCEFIGKFLDWAEPVLGKVGLRHKVTVKFLKQPAVQKITFLHTCACGDFTLLARKRWFDLRAYPEFDLFSMNIDSVFCYVAYHGGVTEEVLPDPMRIYHIEHGTGSGWTPEGQAQLFERIAAKGLSYVSNQDVVAWAAQMRQIGCPMIFNHDDWGLAEFELKESRPQSGQARASLQPSVRRAGDSE